MADPDFDAFEQQEDALLLELAPGGEQSFSLPQDAEMFDAMGNPGQSILDALPHAALVRVISLLPLNEQLNAAVVCTAFRAISQETLASVRELNLSDCHGIKTVRALQWFAECEHGLRMERIVVQGAGSCEALRVFVAHPQAKPRLESLTHLTIDGVKAFNDALLTPLIEFTPNLRTLHLSHCKVSDAGLVAVATNCPKLETLIARDLFAVTNYSMDVISRQCSLLAEVVIDGCVHCSSESVVSLANNCKHLHTLSTAKCYKVSDRALSAFAPPDPHFGKGSLNEAHLNLRSLCLRQNAKIGTVSLLRNCFNLEDLDLTGCSQVTESELKALLVGAGSKMKHLSLSGCRSISGNVLKDVGELCPQLIHLKARGLTIRDEHLRQFAEECSGQLQALNLTWCTSVTDQGLEHVLRKNPHMTHLEVEAVYLLTDTALRLLQRHTLGIQQLNIRMCHCLTADAIVDFAKSMPIISLHLSGLMEEENTKALVRRLKLERPDCKLYS